MADFDALWSPAKVFSPTAAKQYSQSQKDWSYIDQFLSTRYAPTPVPSFERNPSTLSVLLALAAASEAADESHILTRRVKTKAQAELSALDAATTTISTSREPLLVALEEHLTPEGRRSLNSVALLSVALASPDADQRR